MTRKTTSYFDIGYQGSPDEVRAAAAAGQDFFNLFTGALKTFKEQKIENFQLILAHCGALAEKKMQAQFSVLAKAMGYMSADHIGQATALMTDQNRQTLLEQILAETMINNWPLPAPVIHLLKPDLCDKDKLNAFLYRACGSATTEAVKALHAKGADFDEARLDRAAKAAENITLYKNHMAVKKEAAKPGADELAEIRQLIRELTEKVDSLADKNPRPPAPPEKPPAP